MRYVPMHKVSEGMVLGKDMYDFTNHALLRKGKTLTESLIRRLSRFGYQGVYIDDEFSRQIEIEDIISSEMRGRAVQSLKELNLDDARIVAKDIVEKILNADTISLDIINLHTYDDYTYCHSVNVAVLATIIGMGMNYTSDQLRDLCVAGIFHDMGKLSIDKCILNKEEKLTNEEYNIIKQHPQKSYDFFSDKWNISSAVKMGVLCHHENENGTGYPLGLTGNRIHPFAKIIHVVDVYDALSSRRPYKKAYAFSEALEYLMGGSTTMFDEKVVNVFMQYVPIYPKGTSVVLSDGREGVISKNNRASSLRPEILLMDGTKINLMDIEKFSTVTILKQNNEDTITGAEIERIESSRSKNYESCNKAIQ